MKDQLPSRYRDMDDIYYADSCEPLSLAAERGEIALQALVKGHYPGRQMEGDEIPGVKTVGFWDCVKPQAWGLDWHRNEGIELTFLSRGTLGFAVNQKEYGLSAGQLTVTRPWQEHRVGCPHVEPSRLHWCILDVDVRRPNQKWNWPGWVNLSDGDKQALTEILQHNEQPVWQANTQIHDTFEELAKCVEAKDYSTRESRLRLLLSRLLLDVLELLQSKNVVLDEQLGSARRSVQMFIDDLDLILDHKWTLAEMARSCGLRRTQFSRYCQEICNMSPIELLQRKRMEKARKLLRQTPYRSITEIASECGFESSQYFSTKFKSAEGISPRTFRDES